VSVRGPVEALEAAKGGAHIADVEYPASALGTPYPLNILAVHNELNAARFESVLVSTNIGERQYDRASACQAAIGVAAAGADLIKCGLAELPYDAATYQASTIIRSVKEFYPSKTVIPSVFIDKDLRRFFKPFEEGPKLIENARADGLLIDTFEKLIGKGLLDYCSLNDITKFVRACHKIGAEGWVAGSITLEELHSLWATGVDVVCVRGAACESKGKGRFGEVKKEIVAELVATIPK
jgi:uncharacterized protein (UPF0264 family)